MSIQTKTRRKPPRAELDRLMEGRNPAIEKVCFYCWQVKSFLAFSRDNSHVDSLKNYCRKCAAVPHNIIQITEKACKRCGFTKPLTEFYVRADYPDGRQQICRHCSSEMQKEFYDRNRQRDDRISIKYRYCAHCDRTLSISEFYPAKHTRDGLMTWCKSCALSEQQSLDRKARASALSARIATAQYWTYSEAQIEASVAHRIAIVGDPCVYCGARKEKMIWAHSMPAPRHGPDLPENLVRSCTTCAAVKKSSCAACFLAGIDCPPEHAWGYST